MKRSTELNSIINKYRETGEQVHLDQAAEYVQPLIWKIALSLLKSFPSGTDVQDLVQEGSLGFLAAVEKFDPERCSEFSAYNHAKIKQAILDYRRNKGELSRQSQHYQARFLAMKNRLSDELGRSPTRPELVAELGMSESQYDRIVAEIRAQKTFSYSVDDSDDCERNGDWATSALIDHQTPPPDYKCEVADYWEFVSGHLTEQQKKMAIPVLKDDKQQCDVADEIGISHSRASQLVRGALDRLRRKRFELAEQCPA